MMNVDKRRLSDPLLKLDEILDSKTNFTGCRLGDGVGLSQSSGHQDTNAIDMQ